MKALQSKSRSTRKGWVTPPVFISWGPDIAGSGMWASKCGGGGGGGWPCMDCCQVRPPLTSSKMSGGGSGMDSCSGSFPEQPKAVHVFNILGPKVGSIYILGALGIVWGEYLGDPLLKPVKTRG